MTEPESLRVFVNGRALTMPRDTTILDAIRAFDPAAATAVTAAERAVTDSRGLPVTPGTPLSGGMVLRLVSARALRDDAVEGA
jgi:hypothetical protein